jgi:hypothetical protein
MKTAALTAIVLVVLLGGGDPRSQELSTEVFPSEDEIYQALRSGEITYQQYLILQEIAAHGLDSSSLHLLDEIPNLSFFQLDSNSLATALEQEQEVPFKDTDRPVSRSRAISGSVRHAYYRFAEEDGRSRYGTSAQVTVSDNLTADIKLRREYGGRERVTSRAISYKNRHSPVRSLIVGSYSSRLGMGTVLGYRGKILSYSGSLDSESFLFPDFGGYNGVSTLLSSSRVRLQALGSVVRDDDFRMSAAGGMIQLTGVAFSPGLLLAVSRLRNRATSQSVTDFKYGLNARYEYHGGYCGFEICAQAGERASPGAIVAEGRHRFRKAEIKYAGWSYAENYIDLTGGSKAGNLYHKTRLEKVDFEYTGKRSGQSGGLVKTVVNLTQSVELANSVLYVAFNADTTDIQWLAEISRKIGGMSLSLNFLVKGRERVSLEAVRRQSRFVARFRTEKLYLRTHIGYISLSAERDCFSVFLNLKVRPNPYYRVELWSHILEIDHGAGRINYWHAFFRNSFSVTDGLNVAARFGHTYNRDALDAHQTIMSCELSFSF